MSLTLSALQVLPVANDSPTFFMSLQPTQGGRTNYIYSSPSMAFRPSTNTLTANSVNLQVGSVGIGAAASGVKGEIVAINNITAYYSDDRLKTRQGNIVDALTKTLSLNGFHYHANDLAQSLGYKIVPEVGVSAQEVQKVLPEAVVPAPIDNQYLTVHYQKLIPLLIEAIKELNAKVESLEKKCV